MNEVLIYVNETLIDLYPGENIALTFQSINVGNINKRSANYSNTIKIPKTENNNVVFGNADLIKSSTNKPYRKQTVKVVQNGVEVVQNGVGILRDIEGSYSLEIFSGVYDIFSVIGTKLINRLDFSDINNNGLIYPFTAAGWSDSRADDVRNTTDGIIAAVIQYGVNLRSVVGAITTEVYATLTDNDTPYYLPSFFYHTIVERIISQAGYYYDGEIFSDEKYNSLIITAGNSGSSSTYDDDFYKDRSFKAYTNGNMGLCLSKFTGMSE